MGRAREKVTSAELSSAAMPRNFTLGTAATVRALTIGVPSYSARKRRIEDTLEDLADKLVEKELDLRSSGYAGEDLAVALRDFVERLDLRQVNRLVEMHNRYYPIEANLRTDPRTGAYLLKHDLPFEPEPEVTTTSLLEEHARASMKSRDRD